jgi:DNA-binding transcriptional LysR family regulator
VTVVELTHLRTFCAVIEKRSFTRAEEIVHRTQSTISTQIAQLEREYGVTLLNRFQKEVVPTENGQILYSYAKKILRLIDESQERILKSKKIISGSIVIGASTIPGTYILPKILSIFKKRYPKLNISIAVSDSEDVITKILSRTLEIGAVGEKIKDNRLEYVHLAKDRIVLITPSRHRWLQQRKNILLDDLINEPFISREEGSGTRAAVDALLKQKSIKMLNIIMEVGSTEAVKQAVKSGIGVSLVSELAIKDGSLKTVKIKGVDIIRDFYIVFLKSGVKKHTVQSFIDFIKTK